MSFTALAYLVDVLPATKLPPSARAVAWPLAWHANDNNEAWPSVRTLAAEAGLAGGNVRRNLAKLVASGVIAAEHRPGRSTVYRFPIGLPELIHTPRASARGELSTVRAPARGGARASARGVRAPARADRESEREKETRAHPAPYVGDHTCLECGKPNPQWQWSWRCLDCRAKPANNKPIVLRKKRTVAP